MFSIIVAGVDSRVIVQTSLSVITDRRQQSLKKLRRFKLNSGRLESVAGDNNKADEDVTQSWLSAVTERQSQLISTPLSSSLVPPAEDVNVVPDISRLDFSRRFPARSRLFRGSSLNHPVWRLTDEDVDRDEGRGSRITGLLPRTVEHSGLVDRPTSDREWRTAVLAAVTTCFVVGLLLTVIAVWLRRRRRALRTTIQKL